MSAWRVTPDSDRIDDKPGSATDSVCRTRRSETPGHLAIQAGARYGVLGQQADRDAFVHAIPLSRG